MEGRDTGTMVYANGLLPPGGDCADATVAGKDGGRTSGGAPIGSGGGPADTRGGAGGMAGGCCGRERLAAPGKGIHPYNSTPDSAR